MTPNVSLNRKPADKRAEPKRTGEPETAPSLPSLAHEDAPINILIVDDEPKNLAVLESLLDDSSYRVVRAASGDEALLALIAEEFALLILDIRMPGMTGFELAHMVKSRKKTAAIPIIFLTAYYNEDQHVLEGYESGAVDYLQKPVNPAILRSKVSVFAHLYRTNREIGTVNRALLAEVAKRRDIEGQLREANEDLERRVIERTNELRQNQFHLRQATEAARLTYLELDFVHGHARAAENFSAVMGYTLPPGMDASAGTRHLLGHVVAEERMRMELALQELAGGKPFAKFDYRILGDDQIERWIQSECFAEFGRDGSWQRAFITNLDVTARKQSELALRVSEERFRQLANSMPQMVWTALPSGYVDYCNDRWRDFAGLDPQKPEQIRWEAILHPDDLNPYLSAWKRSLETGETFELEYRLCDHRSQRYGWYLGRAIPVRDETGMIVKWFGTCTNIEVQKRTEEDLRRSNQTLEQFAFAASHDLQEPLRNVTIYSELLKAEYESRLDEQGQGFLQIIIEGSQRMSNLIAGLLTYTLTLRTEPDHLSLIEAEPVLERVLKNLDSLIRESRASITHGSLPMVLVEEVHLEQLLQNLIGNAIKYSKEEAKPQVDISAQRQSNLWRLAVRDNGIGIAPEYQMQVFQVFKRLHAPGGRYRGTGIGLAICHKIVAHYGGRIWVESEPNIGSTFFVELPT